MITLPVLQKKYPQFVFIIEGSGPTPCTVYTRDGDWPGTYVTSAAAWTQIGQTLAAVEQAFKSGSAN